MFQVERRLQLIKSNISWEDYLDFAILVVGVLGFLITRFGYKNPHQGGCAGLD